MMITRLPLLAVLAVGGCTPSAFDATLTDHADLLTTAGSDRLFEVDVSDADTNVEAAAIQLTFQPVGGNRTVLNFTLTDSDNDGALGPGDSLVATEPGVDLLNATNAGQSFTISLAEKTGASTISELWTDSWQAR